MINTKEKVKHFLAKKILLHPNALEEARPELVLPEQLLVLHKECISLLSQHENWIELEGLYAEFEKTKDENAYLSYKEKLNQPGKKASDGAQPNLPEEMLRYPVHIVRSYNEQPHKFSVQDFTRYFHLRYNALEKLLRNRVELQGALSLNRVVQRPDREKVVCIALIAEKSETKGGNIVFTLEDPTGMMQAVVSSEKKELLQLAKDVMFDEVVGIIGTKSPKTIYIDNIIWPDVPERELKKHDEEIYAIFLSDIHVGSRLFLQQDFDRFLKWLRGEVGNEQQRAIAKNVRFLFIAGDVIDGVGVYPNQDKELAIKDVYGQYEECVRLLSQVPQNVSIVLAPGNHDAIYLAEPQPVFYKEIAKLFAGLPNITLVSNPALVTICQKESFSGFHVLMYHGYSFDYYVANVDSIRNNGGYHRGDLIMRYLLKRRHLAPSFASTLLSPAYDHDPLVIDVVPDIFITGHIHYSVAANYKNITMISGSCWQGKTTFQEKLGHTPEPARVPCVNLKTREIKILKFGEE